MKPLLVPILIIAACGLAFSGYLTYRELFASAAPLCTPVGDPGSALGAPPCVYGFFVYLAILVLTVVALVRYRTSKP